MTHGPESGSSLERRHGLVGQRSPHFVEVSAVTQEPDDQRPNQSKVNNGCTLDCKMVSAVEGNVRAALFGLGQCAVHVRRRDDRFLPAIAHHGRRKGRKGLDLGASHTR